MWLYDYKSAWKTSIVKKLTIVCFIGMFLLGAFMAVGGTYSTIELIIDAYAQGLIGKYYKQFSQGDDGLINIGRRCILMRRQFQFVLGSADGEECASGLSLGLSQGRMSSIISRMCVRSTILCKISQLCYRFARYKVRIMHFFILATPTVLPQLEKALNTKHLESMVYLASSKHFKIAKFKW